MSTKKPTDQSSHTKPHYDLLRWNDEADYWYFIGIDLTKRELAKRVIHLLYDTSEEYDTSFRIIRKELPHVKTQTQTKTQTD